MVSLGFIHTARQEHKRTISEKALIIILIRTGEIKCSKWPVCPETKILPITLGID
jgi:hypothetical protein